MTNGEIVSEFMADPEVQDAVRAWATQRLLNEEKPVYSVRANQYMIDRLEFILGRAQTHRMRLAQETALFVEKDYDY